MVYPTQAVVSQNPGLATGSAVRLSVPSISSLLPGCVRLTNRELLLVVDATFTAGVAPGTVDSEAVMVSSGFSFGWLGKFSDIYDRYIFQSLRLEYEPVLPTTTSGSIVMYFDTDATETPPTSYVTASGNFNATTSPIWGKAQMKVPKDMLQTRVTFKTGSSGATDQNEYVTGTLVVATTSVALLNTAVVGSNVIGYVWADYVVDLCYPTAV